MPVGFPAVRWPLGDVLARSVAPRGVLERLPSSARPDPPLDTSPVVLSKGAAMRCGDDGWEAVPCADKGRSF